PAARRRAHRRARHPDDARRAEPVRGAQPRGPDLDRGHPRERGRRPGQAAHLLQGRQGRGRREDADPGMNFVELVRFAAGAIIAHPLRSGLTSLGVVIGVAAVVMMTSIGLGAQQRVTSTIAGLGSNLIIVQPGAARAGGGGGGGGFVMGGAGTGMSLTEKDAEATARDVEGAVAVAPVVRGQAQLAAEGANWNTRIEGVTPDYLIARDLTLASGRMFDEREARQGRK